MMRAPTGPQRRAKSTARKSTFVAGMYIRPKSVISTLPGASTIPATSNITLTRGKSCSMDASRLARSSSVKGPPLFPATVFILKGILRVAFQKAAGGSRASLRPPMFSAMYFLAGPDLGLELPRLARGNTGRARTGPTCSGHDDLRRPDGSRRPIFTCQGRAGEAKRTSARRVARQLRHLCGVNGKRCTGVNGDRRILAKLIPECIQQDQANMDWRRAAVGEGPQGVGVAGGFPLLAEQGRIRHTDAEVISRSTVKVWNHGLGIIWRCRGKYRSRTGKCYSLPLLRKANIECHLRGHRGRVIRRAARAAAKHHHGDDRPAHSPALLHRVGVAGLRRKQVSRGRANRD